MKSGQNICQKQQDTKNVIDLGNKSLESEYFSNLKKNMTTVFVFLFHANTDQLKL